MLSEARGDTHERLPNECYEMDPNGFRMHYAASWDDLWLSVYSRSTLREAEVFMENLEEIEYEASETDSADFSDTESMCLYKALLKIQSDEALGKD